jgi:hypothetical protein
MFILGVEGMNETNFQGIWQYMTLCGCMLEELSRVQRPGDNPC